VNAGGDLLVGMRTDDDVGIGVRMLTLESVFGICT
jgi:hypothetical protein